MVINEFGDIPLDPLFVEKSEGEITVLANGCLCCDVQGDLEGVIGRLFEVDLLRDVHPVASREDTVAADLEHSAELDLTRLEQADPRLAYLFTHVITQEVVYDLFEKRIIARNVDRFQVVLKPASTALFFTGTQSMLGQLGK